MRRYLVKWLIPAALLVAAVIMTAVALRQQTAPAVQPAQEISMAEQGYLLRLEGITLSVYRQGESEPIAEHEILPSLLPEEDRKRLEEGITIRDLSELQRRLEDFLG